jgi:peptidoglycan L-alanyl-D-glutamate endopeptidase CwlK
VRKWSKSSKHVYDTLDERLQILVTRIRDEVCDISLVYPYGGHRNRAVQENLYGDGKSHLHYPHSKHNKFPSLAVDLQPYPYPTYEPKLWGALGYIAGRAYAIADEEGFSIRWGGDWNGNGDLTDQKFDDLFHIEVDDIEEIT